MKKSHMHINKGLLFNHYQYESDYAIIRRLLTVNPGMTYHVLIEKLRENYQETPKPFRAIKHVYGREDALHCIKGIFKSHKRQCPECAKYLYHTYYYSVQWLTHCPIHHCEFTLVCPECQQIWPDLKELLKRKCHTCGINSFEYMCKVILPGVNSMNFNGLRELANIFSEPVEPKTITFNSFFDYTPGAYVNAWETPVVINNPRYPYLYLDNHTEMKLKHLQNHVEIIAMKKRSSRIFLQEIHFSKQKINKDTASNLYYFVHLDKYEYDVFKFIVNYILKHSPEHRIIHIDDYRFTSIDNILTAPDFCPYCMAFSIWLFNICFLRYFRCEYEERSDFLFLNECEFNGLYTPHKFRIYGGFLYEYTADNLFNAWYYKRGLEISFLEILRFIVDLLDDKNVEGSDNDKMKGNSSLNKVNSYQYYEIVVNKDKLTYYYENEHPLKDFNLPDHYNITSTCNNYREYKDREFTSGVLFHHCLDTSNLNYQKYLKLCNMFFDSMSLVEKMSSNSIQ